VKLALGIGAVALIYYAWTQGVFQSNGAPPMATDAGGAGGAAAAGVAGTSMTAGGQAATVYGFGQQLGHTVNAATLAIRRTFPITAPTPQNPITAAVKAVAAAAVQMPPAPADGAPPNRMLVPVVRGTTAATPIS
jgi:hypothetical protein